MTATSHTMERAYESLAQAIDRAGPEQEALFLARLALTLAHEIGDAEQFERCIRVALDDLPAATSVQQRASPSR